MLLVIMVIFTGNIIDSSNDFGLLVNFEPLSSVTVAHLMSGSIAHGYYALQLNTWLPRSLSSMASGIVTQCQHLENQSCEIS